MANVGFLPVEVAESEFHIRIPRTELIRGSEGGGRFKGGRGIRREYLVVDEPATVMAYCEQTDPRFAPRGVDGGEDAGPSRLWVIDSAGSAMDLPSKITVKVDPGTLIRIETSGGGGYGRAEPR
jgi:N-methylhydantoinase B